MEVRSSVAHIMVSLLVNKETRAISNAFNDLKASLLKGDIQAFCKTFQSMLAGVTYDHHKRDATFYHALFEFAILGLGLTGESEVQTSKGRSDFVLYIDNKIYIFELKLNAAPEKALEQIEDRNYGEKYLLTGKEVIYVGFSFHYEHKQLSISCMEKVC